MKYFLIIFSFLWLSSCKNKEDEYHAPENALDAGREFIEQSLRGKFNTANQYMLQDKDNQYWLARSSEQFNRISEQEKASYNKSSIRILEVNDVIPDSVTIINFSNSFKNTPQKLKVIKYQGQWKVDFKYTFSGNS